MRQDPASQPLDPLAELDALLDEIALDDDVMLLGEVDGLLAALLVVPAPIAQEEWLPLVWGGVDERAPDTPDAQHARRLAELLLARKGAIAVDLLRGPGTYDPIYEIDPFDEIPMWEIWVEGFGQAVALRHAAWLALLNSTDTEVAAAAAGLTALMALAADFRKDRALADEAPELIPQSIETIYRHQRGLVPATPPQAIAAPILLQR